MKSTYLAIVGITVLVVAAIVALTITGSANSTSAIVEILGFVAPTMAGLLALVKASETSTKQDSLSVAVNGRLTELLARTAEAQHAAGVVQGHAAGVLQAKGEIHPAEAIAPLIVPQEAIQPATISPAEAPAAPAPPKEGI